ncbi:MAG: carboxylating nicotinate-nucleotide diphosphorylase [Candidatus Bathyarchaeota archaeon]|jgi:nicotinate-nucleotide pyrophosphorylase (carboxylating)
MYLPHTLLSKKIIELLIEDLGQGDVTTGLLVPTFTSVKAEVIAKEPGIIAGIEETKTLLKSFGTEVKCLIKDGDKIETGKVLMRISGDARTILSLERTILNILSHMSGIATTTRSLIEKIRKAGLKAKVACTRKVSPGLLYFDKKAVSIGGGDTHRFHLDDMIIVKDNHIAISGGIEKAIKRIREKVSFTKKIEVEVSSVADALKAAKMGVDIVMLDNFSPQQVEEAAKLLKQANCNRNILIEVSGGITKENILRFASKDVDIISLGEITQKTKGLDINLEILKPKTR